MITVYILRSKTNGRRYVGITNNLPRRLNEHKRSSTTVGKLLGSFDLLHCETYADYTAARAREKFLKSGKGREWMDRTVGSRS